MKRSVCLSVLGLPGAGKSTLIGCLARLLCAPVMHVGKFARDHGLGDESSRHSGLLLKVPGLEELFLNEACLRIQTNNVILDGFPRSPDQVMSLQLAWQAAGRTWDHQVIHLAFPAGYERQMSFERQRSRAVAEGTVLDEPRWFGKIDRAFACDLPAIAEMRSLGFPVAEISALLTPDDITRQSMQCLRGG